MERYEAETITLLAVKNLPNCRLYITDDIGLKQDDHFSPGSLTYKGS
jgi:hypothetical protein